MLAHYAILFHQFHTNIIILISKRSLKLTSRAISSFYLNTCQDLGDKRSFMYNNKKNTRERAGSALFPSVF